MNECTVKGEIFECDALSRSPKYDARGIYLTMTCHRCHASKMDQYRPEVLSDPNYDSYEPIDEDY